MINMKDEPLLRDECSDCVNHETALREKDNQISQLKQAILLQYSAGDDEQEIDVDKKWLEVISEEFAEVANAKKALEAKLESQTQQTQVLIQI